MFRAVDFPVFKQMDQMDCGPACLKMITKYFGKDYPLDYLREISSLEKGGVSFTSLSYALEKLGFDSVGIKATMEELVEEIELPVVAHWQENHFIVVYKVNRKSVFVSDPAFGKIKYSHEEFLQNWGDKNNGKGILLLVEPTEEFGLNELPSKKNNNGLNFLLEYLTPYQKFLKQIVLGLLMACLIQLMLPFLTQSLVDYGINYEDIGFIYLIIIGQLFLFISYSASQLIRDWILLRVSTHISINMISDFLDKLLKLPTSYFDSKTSGDFMQRIYDHQRVESFLRERALIIPFDLLNIILFGAILFYFDNSIATVFTLGTLLFFGWSLVFMARKEILDNQLFDLNRKEHSLFIQMISTVTEINLNNSERRRKQEWKTNQVNLFTLNSKVLKVDQAQINGGRFIIEITKILIIFWSALAVIRGEITLGTMLAIQFIIGSLSLPISNIVEFLTGYQRAILSINRMAEIHNEPSKEQSFKYSQIEAGDIRVVELNFSYGINKLILRNINFEILRGKTTAIVGPSGSGKTTLLKVLLKMYSPQSGSIFIGDKDLEDLNSKTWRNMCGVVMQDGKLFNDSIERNITESKSDYPVDKQLLERAITIANLNKLIEKLPYGLQTQIGEEGQILSGGEKQRLLIARAVYKNPDYLFFDEATSSLDAENEFRITDNLISFFKHKTAIIIAHRLSTVKNADQIIVMNDGAIMEQGNHLELIRKKGLYFKLIKYQLK